MLQLSSLNMTGKAETRGKNKATTDLGKTYKIDNKSEAMNDCGECAREVKGVDDGMQCDDCLTWYHLKCCKLSKAVYELLKKYDELQWRCTKCKNETMNMRKRNEQLSEENKLLHERLAVLDRKFESLKNDIKTEVIMDINERITSEVKKTVRDSFAEIIDREQKQKRENNLILYNLAESSKSDGKEREKDDHSISLKVMEHCVEGGKSYNLDKIIRLGKNDQRENESRPRPLLIKFQNVSDKWNVLKNAWHLKTATQECKGVIIAPDLTKEEREKEKILRMELKQRKERGETNLRIRRGEIVKENFRQT